MTRTLLPACLAALFLAGGGHAQETIELPGEDRPLVLEPSEVYRIGSVDAIADWELLNVVRGAGFDESGNLYFLNSPNRVVTVRPDGSFLRQFGRTGGGPGEFGDAGQLDVWPSGRIVVSDLRRRAFHFFGPEGVFERTVRMALDMPDLDVLLRDVYYWVRAEAYGARPARAGAAIFSDGIRKIVRTDLSSDEARVRPFVEAWAPPGTEAKFGSLAEVTGGPIWGLSRLSSSTRCRGVGSRFRIRPRMRSRSLDRPARCCGSYAAQSSRNRSPVGSDGRRSTANWRS